MINNILKRSEELKIKNEQLSYRFKNGGWTPAIQIEVDNLEREVKYLKAQLDKYEKDNNIVRG